MKFMLNFVVLITLLAIACVGMHLYIVEKEFNDIRQAKVYNTKVLISLNRAMEAVDFARGIQHIAIMAEERASGLASKLEMAALVVATLEDQLRQATIVDDSQCKLIQDLIDQNSALQNSMSWLEEAKRATTDELDKVTALLAATQVELDEALKSIVELNKKLDESTK